MKLAILDDYQGTARDMADWSELPAGVEVTFFHDHIVDENQLVERLKDFDLSLIHI